jgi:hypothetical protein
MLRDRMSRHRIGMASQRLETMAQIPVPLWKRYPRRSPAVGIAAGMTTRQVS